MENPAQRADVRYYPSLHLCHRGVLYSAIVPLQISVADTHQRSDATRFHLLRAHPAWPRWCCRREAHRRGRGGQSNEARNGRFSPPWTWSRPRQRKRMHVNWHNGTEKKNHAHHAPAGGTPCILPRVERPPAPGIASRSADLKRTFACHVLLAVETRLLASGDTQHLGKPSGIGRTAAAVGSKNHCAAQAFAGHAGQPQVAAGRKQPGHGGGGRDGRRRPHLAGVVGKRPGVDGK